MKKIMMVVAMGMFAAVTARAEGEPDYLSFTAHGGDVTIGMEWIYGTPKAYHTFEWATDKTADEADWTEFVSGTSTMTVHKGETVYFRRKGEEKVMTLNPGESGQAWQFTMTPVSTDATIAAGGNVMSLLDATCKRTEVDVDAFSYLFHFCTVLTAAPKLPATTLAKRCYYGMFYDCTSLTAAPELPAMTLAEECYSTMFRGCTLLTAAPKLPATTLAKSCYSSMFSGCTSLTAAPELPATTLVEACYSCMFSYCTSLTVAPQLPATTLAGACYVGMFGGCTALGWIKVGFTEWSNATQMWVDGVPAGGMFVCPGEQEDNRGKNCIPNGWTKAEAESVRFVTVPKVEHLQTAVTMNGSAVTPLKYADNTRWPVLANAKVQVAFAADEGYRVAGTASYSIDSMTDDVIFGQTEDYPRPKVGERTTAYVSFQKRTGVLKIEFKCDGEGDFAEFPSEGMNLWSGTEIDLRVTPATNYRYMGETHFVVSSEGLNETIAASEIALGDVERPWVAGESVTVHTNETTLVIGGTGAMDDFASAAEVPWNEAAEIITRLQIAEGVNGDLGAVLAILPNLAYVNGLSVSMLPRAAMAPAEVERVKVVNGDAQLTVAVAKSSNPEAVEENWNKAKIKAVAFDEEKGEVTLTVPADFANGYMILKTKDAESTSGGVKSGQTVGMLSVQSSAKQAAVGVAWEKLGGGDLTVETVLGAMELAEGDLIHVYDQEQKLYQSWAWTGEGWSGAKTVTASGTSEPPPAGEVRLPRGSTFWLERENTANPIILAGRYVAGEATAPQPVIEPGSSEQKAWNLIANPKGESFDLNEVVKGDINAKDQILVPTEGAPIVYTYEGGAWGCMVNEKVDLGGGLIVVRPRRSTDSAHTTIPAGRGFWYISAGGEPSFEW